MSHKTILITLLLAILLAACNENLSFNEEKTISNNYPSLLSQQIIEMNKTTDGKLSKEDFARFAEQIEGARIVGLGEQTHGASEVFSLKNQLIQYLHQEHGFEIFILESGMYEVNTLWQQAKKNQRIKDFADGNVFYMYANSEEITPLFDYINEQANTEKPLTLVGFDSQHTGELSNKNLINDLESLLKENNYTFPKHWPLFRQQLQLVLDISTKRLSAENESIFFAQLSQIQQAFLIISQQTKTENNSNNYNQAGFWFRISRGLEAQAKRQWKITDTRSQEMGENIKWWANQYPDKKIIVWAHSGHLYRTGYKQINAGQVVSEHFAEQYYMVHFTSNEGQFLNFVDMKIQDVQTTNENSFEQIVTQASKTDLTFVNVVPQSLLAPELTNNKIGIMASDYQDIFPLNRWDTKMDGVFVFKQITPAQYERR